MALLSLANLIPTVGVSPSTVDTFTQATVATAFPRVRLSGSAGEIVSDHKEGLIVTNKKRITPFRPISPTPAALITCTDAEGTPNIIAVAEVFNLSIARPVIVGIAIRPVTYSHELIAQTGEFTINLTSPGLVEKVDQCGSVTGRGGVNKFEVFGLTAVQSDEIRPPLIAECAVNLECRVLQQHSIGDHDLFVAEVLAVHADPSVLDEKERVQPELLDPLLYVHREYFRTGEWIGKHGFTNTAAPRNSN